VLDVPSRRDRVLAVIRDKGQVTIKDISNTVTDVSEKTIQRELMSLISEGQIKKTGERRWSKYALDVAL
jgi:DeoR/GlpR family transcriptional regulator of sugar metabolism